MHAMSGAIVTDRYRPKPICRYLSQMEQELVLFLIPVADALLAGPKQ